MISELKSGNKDKTRLNDLRYLLGELQRKKKKIYTDDELQHELKSKVRNLKENIDSNPNLQSLLDLINDYLPKQISKSEIIDYIKNNIDFKQLKSKNQAIGIVTKHFGILVNGPEVKTIIDQEF